MDPSNGIQLSLNIGQFGEESYAAAQINDASWAKFDLLFNETWRIAGGVRHEDYRQVSVPLDLLGFEGSRIAASPKEIAAGVIAADEYYPSLAFTYILPGFWADEFQFRVAWSEDNILFTFVNGESGEIYGVEIEWLKVLSSISDRLIGFRIQLVSSRKLDAQGQVTELAR